MGGRASRTSNSSMSGLEPVCRRLTYQAGRCESVEQLPRCDLLRPSPQLWRFTTHHSANTVAPRRRRRLRVAHATTDRPTGRVCAVCGRNENRPPRAHDLELCARKYCYKCMHATEKSSCVWVFGLDFENKLKKVFFFSKSETAPDASGTENFWTLFLGEKGLEMRFFRLFQAPKQRLMCADVDFIRPER